MPTTSPTPGVRPTDIRTEVVQSAHSRPQTRGPTDITAAGIPASPVASGVPLIGRCQRSILTAAPSGLHPRRWCTRPRSLCPVRRLETCQERDRAP